MKFPRLCWTVTCLGLLVSGGCCLNRSKLEFCDSGCYDDALVERYAEGALVPEDPCIDECFDDPWIEPLSPRAIGQGGGVDPNGYQPYHEVFANIKTHSISLNECIAIAMQNSEMMRDLGGTVLRNPNGATTLYDPAIAYADPRVGEEAALSAFDANLFASAYFDFNDRVFNNAFFGQNGLLVQDLADYRWGITKQSATGSTFTFRHVTNSENNNQLGNQYVSPNSVYDTYIEAEIRQPLLQGAGVLFNRINGSSQEIGVYNGILIARANSDISLAQFEAGVRDLVSNVENAYWDLYFAYRDLDAKVRARNSALETWRKISEENRVESQTESGINPDEAQAREQFFRFEAEVIDSLYGRLVDGTRTNNGSSSGTFRSNGGLRVAERRLRLVMGEMINDDHLLQPNDSPAQAPIRFDWATSTHEATSFRAEIRQQRWRVKQREMELIASKNYLLPRLDAVGRYRMRGFGDEFLTGDGGFQPPGTGQTIQSSSAISDMFNGDRQEWQVGIELNVPIGFRREHAAVRNAELRLNREKAVLKEQEREVMFGLSNAVDELYRSYEALRTQYNRRFAASEQAQAVTEAYEQRRTSLDVVLEAQRRLVDAELRYYQGQVEYMLAIRNVHFEKGTLLDYCDVHLSEALWPSKAYEDARNRDCLKGDELDYVCRDLTIASGRHGDATHFGSEMILSDSVGANEGAPTSSATMDWNSNGEWNGDAWNQVVPTGGSSADALFPPATDTRTNVPYQSQGAPGSSMQGSFSAIPSQPVNQATAFQSPIASTRPFGSEAGNGVVIAPQAGEVVPTAKTFESGVVTAPAMRMGATANGATSHGATSTGATTQGVFANDAVNPGRDSDGEFISLSDR